MWDSRVYSYPVSGCMSPFFQFPLQIFPNASTKLVHQELSLKEFFVCKMRLDCESTNDEYNKFLASSVFQLLYIINSLIKRTEKRLPKTGHDIWKALRISCVDEHECCNKIPIGNFQT